MASYTFTPQGVCSRLMTFDIEDGKLHNVHVMGGCPGNLAAIGRLLEGADAVKTVETLKGTDCAGKGTSCADQLSIAIAQALENEKKTALQI